MDATNQDGSRRRDLGDCTVCDTALPLRAAGPGEDEVAWKCAQCGARYEGVVHEGAHPKLLGNVVAEDEAQAAVLAARLAESQPRFTGVPQQLAESVTAVPDDRVGVRSTANNTFSQAMDAAIANGNELSAASQGEPFDERVPARGAEPYDPRAIEAAMDRFYDSLWKVSDVFAALEEGDSADLPTAENVARSSLDSAAADIDLFAALGISTTARNYPTRHSLHVGNLAIAIGVALGYDERTLIELSTGCLLHDVGMLRVDEHVWKREEPLPPHEFAVVADHPCESVAMIGSEIESLAYASRMVIYQTHERVDGNGYPRGCRREQIHELARVAAVADAFVGLVSPRPHRKAMTPYHAMAKLLHDVKGGRYDTTVVRALLKTVSLFPLGSYFSLSDGRIARVFRVNRENYTQPIVEVWRPGHYDDSADIVDLSAADTLKITAPVDRLPD